MNALRKVHAALVPGGIVVDTQPVSAWPRVGSPAAELGALDMRDWLRIVDGVDQQVDLAIAEGLFTSEVEPAFEVADTFDSGPAVIDTVKNWQGTSITPELAERLACHSGVVRVNQQVRLRLLHVL